jgi:hypothetical protein
MPETEDWETIRLDLPSKAGTLALTSDITSALQSWQLSNTNCINGRLFVNDTGNGGGFTGGRSGQDSGSFIGFLNNTGFAEIHGPLTLKPIPTSYTAAGMHGILIDGFDDRGVNLDLDGLLIRSDSPWYTLYNSTGINYVNEDDDYETTWNFTGNGDNLTVTYKSNSILSDSYQFDVKMSQVLTGTFDPNSGVLVLSTPVKTAI